MGETRVLLVDGNNIAHRALHAARRTSMHSHDGVHTGALVLYLGIMARAVRMVQPTHLRVCWDSGKSSHRLALFEGYKGNRDQPDDAEWTDNYLRDIRTLTTLLGMISIASPGVEADDLMAVSKRVADETLETPLIWLLSGDKDLLQLVDHKTWQFRAGVVPEMWGKVEVMEKYGVPVKALPYYFALVGDASDNVAGVRGIGPVKARKLLEKADYQWHNLINLLTPQQQQEFVLAHDLVDLVSVVHQHWSHGVPGADASIHEWAPTGPGTALWTTLTVALGEWDMAHAQADIASGRLWKPFTQ